MSHAENKSASANSSTTTVPKAVVGRLSLYLRELQQLVRDGNDTISSTQIGRRLGFTDAQVRKDLAHFGQFGYPGIGYRCEELILAIRQILGTDRDWPVALVGVGNLGRALIGYRGFGRQGFRIAAVFDSDREKVGREIGGLTVHHLDDLPELARSEQIRMAVVTVPIESAQTVVDQLVAAGIEGILNFAPVTLSLDSGTNVQGVDLAMELEQLSFAVINRLKSER